MSQRGVKIFESPPEFCDGGKNGGSAKKKKIPRVIEIKLGIFRPYTTARPASKLFQFMHPI